MKEQDVVTAHKIYHVLQSILLLTVIDSAPTINTVALSSTTKIPCVITYYKQITVITRNDLILKRIEY